MEGEWLVQSHTLDEMKEESMPHLKTGKNEDKDDKIIISGEDVVQNEDAAKEAGTSHVVLTSIHKQKN